MGRALRTGRVGLIIGPAFIVVSILLFIFTAGYHLIAGDMAFVGAMNLATGIMLRVRQTPGWPRRSVA